MVQSSRFVTNRRPLRSTYARMPDGLLADPCEAKGSSSPLRTRVFMPCHLSSNYNCSTDVTTLASHTPCQAEHASTSQVTGCSMMAHSTTTGSAFRHTKLSDGETNESLTVLLFQPHGMRGTQGAASTVMVYASTLKRTQQTWSRRWGVSPSLQPTTITDLMSSADLLTLLHLHPYVALVWTTEFQASPPVPVSTCSPPGEAGASETVSRKCFVHTPGAYHETA